MATEHDVRVTDPEALLRENGFAVEVTPADGGGFRAAQKLIANPSSLVPRYGSGKTAAEAVESAWERYRVEQIG
jgi:hypothetical protein